MLILALDPGSAQTAYCLYINGLPMKFGILENNACKQFLHDISNASLAETPGNVILAVEMIASYGMPVGAEVFNTCVWIGRFIESWGERPHRLIFRKDVKMHLCGQTKAKDSNIRQALIDRFGVVGTKNNPGTLYGMHSDMWAALAVAVTAAESPV